MTECDLLVQHHYITMLCFAAVGAVVGVSVSMMFWLIAKG